MALAAPVLPAFCQASQCPCSGQLLWILDLGWVSLLSIPASSYSSARMIGCGLNVFLLVCESLEGGGPPVLVIASVCFGKWLKVCAKGVNQIHVHTRSPGGVGESGELVSGSYKWYPVDRVCSCFDSAIPRICPKEMLRMYSEIHIQRWDTHLRHWASIKNSTRGER